MLRASLCAAMGVVADMKPNPQIGERVMLSDGYEGRVVALDPESELPICVETPVYGSSGRLWVQPEAIVHMGCG